ncbi:MAG: Aquaporin Z [Candidatus Ordinivivax streblomastigis]|uniref:Aquaporin Z n=1 Tax=Candidatus Ordinivivax streblomastigis TaxID=2540710 RepID=A0A5M8P274_9BACT|nr:MAG: Aquaporin Z [Candidatus Ordinivivax streblomastigis]
MRISQKFVAELIGTFVLVLGGCGTAVFAGSSVGFLGVAIAFGLTVVAMAYGIGHISGAHLNPAVSIGVFCAGRMNAKDLGVYVAAQVIGGILAAALMAFIVAQYGGERGTFAANGYGEAFFQGAAGYVNLTAIGALVTELVLTFVFLIVILGVTDSRSNNSFAGVAIGLTLALIHLISIPLTNTSVNPARSISQALFADNALALPQLWVFIVAPAAGAALAAIVYNAMAGKAKK